MPPFKIDDAVRRKTDPRGPRGRVIGIYHHADVPTLLVQWNDPAMFPNPTVEPEDGLEMA